MIFVRFFDKHLDTNSDHDQKDYRDSNRDEKYSVFLSGFALNFLRRIIYNYCSLRGVFVNSFRILLNLNCDPVDDGGGSLNVNLGAVEAVLLTLVVNSILLVRDRFWRVVG